MINPTGMTLRDWADSTILSVNDAWGFSRLDDEKLWQAWGVAFLSAVPFTQQAPPNPYQFSDWREWAMRIYILSDFQS